MRRFDSILVSGFQVTFNLTQNINYIVIKKGKKLDEITSLSLPSTLFKLCQIKMAKAKLYHNLMQFTLYSIFNQF